MSKRAQRVLVVFNTISLYGMERSVIETFDLLRPDVDPIFLIRRFNQRYRTPLFEEIRSRGFHYRFFSDYWWWPLVGKPRGLRSFINLPVSILLANLDVLRNSFVTDCLYLPGWISGVYSLIAAIVFRLTRRKVIYFFHDLMLNSPHKISFSALLSTDLVHYAQYSLDAVSTVTPFVLSKRNHVIPPAIELRIGDATQHRSDKRKFVFLGQVAFHKGIDLLVKAFKNVSQSHPEAELHVVGGCAPGLDETLRGLLDGCRSIQIWGYIDRAHTILDGAYAYVHPSPPSRFHESFGRGAVEAMALGVPVICFASGALQEIVRDGLNGLLCKEESAESLAEQMARLLNDPCLRDHLAEGALCVYSQEYSNDLVTEAWLRLLGVAQHTAPVTVTATLGINRTS